MLIEKIKNRTAVVGVMGLGYVGLPLLVEFAKAGFRAIGFEVDSEKVAKIRAGQSYIVDVESATLRSLVSQGKLEATEDFGLLGEADTVSICVPTPLRKTKDPDISYIVQATQAVKQHLHPGMLVVLESTTYPGTTRELLLPEFQARGLQVGRDFYLAFSPERIDPGNRHFNTRNIPKVIGGITGECTEVAALLYGQIVERVVKVSSSDAAEMVKILENTFRAVNIGLVNEIAIICHKLGIDTWEVIEAASTKPFGFMKFTPGPGLGGHCIPVDPHYLAWKLKGLNYTARFIELASEVNSHMPDFVVQKVSDALNERRKCLNGSRILVLGVTYKKDVEDIRESPALDIIELLRQKGAIVAYHDPYVPELRTDGIKLQRVDLQQRDPGPVAKGFDCIIIGTDHSWYDYEAIAESAQLIVDTRNALSDRRATYNGKIVRL